MRSEEPAITKKVIKVNAYKRLTLSFVLAGGLHFTLLVLPGLLSPARSSSVPSGALGEKSQSQTIKPQFLSNADESDKNIAARVTSNDETLKMNNGSKPTKQISQPPTDSTKELSENSVRVEPNVDSAKYVHSKRSAQKSLKQVIQETSRLNKATLKSSMSRSDYLRYKHSMNCGRMKGVPTPNLAFAYKDLSEILTVHKVFGIKVVALDPQKPSTVVELVGLGTENTYCQRIENFNGKAYSNRIYRRTEPFFTKFMPECQKLLANNSVLLISMTPANTDAYFRYKILEVIKRNGYKEDAVSTAIARFHKTSFSAMVLVIEKLHMKDGTIQEVNDFEHKRIING